MHWFCGFEHVAAKPWVHLFAGQATVSEKRICSGTFALMPLGSVYLVRLCFEQMDSIAAPLFMAGFLLAGSLWLSLCVRFIPAKVLWVAGTIGWLVLLALALTGRV
jgi:hypothetical protein